MDKTELNAVCRHTVTELLKLMRRNVLRSIGTFIQIRNSRQFFPNKGVGQRIRST